MNLKKNINNQAEQCFFKTENLGYSHAYLSNDNSELLAIEVLTDPEFLKSINVVGELTISNKFRCEALK